MVIKKKIHTLREANSYADARFKLGNSSSYNSIIFYDPLLGGKVSIPR